MRRGANDRAPTLNANSAECAETEVRGEQWENDREPTPGQETSIADRSVAPAARTWRSHVNGSTGRCCCRRARATTRHDRPGRRWSANGRRAAPPEAGPAP